MDESLGVAFGEEVRQTAADLGRGGLCDRLRVFDDALAGEEAPEGAEGGEAAGDGGPSGAVHGQVIDPSLGMIAGGVWQLFDSVLGNELQEEADIAHVVAEGVARRAAFVFKERGKVIEVSCPLLRDLRGVCGLVRGRGMFECHASILDQV